MTRSRLSQSAHFFYIQIVSHLSASVRLCAPFFFAFLLFLLMPESLFILPKPSLSLSHSSVESHSSPFHHFFCSLNPPWRFGGLSPSPVSAFSSRMLPKMSAKQSFFGNGFPLRCAWVIRLHRIAPRTRLQSGAVRKWGGGGVGVGRGGSCL